MANYPHKFRRFPVEVNCGVVMFAKLCRGKQALMSMCYFLSKGMICLLLTAE